MKKALHFFLPQNSWWVLSSDPCIKNYWRLVNELIWRVQNDFFVRQESLRKDYLPYLMSKPECITCHVKFHSDASLNQFEENLNIKQWLSSILPAYPSTHLSFSTIFFFLVNFSVSMVLFLHICHLHTCPPKICIQSCI